MKQRFRHLLLWLWPRIKKLYARFDLRVDLTDQIELRKRLDALVASHSIGSAQPTRVEGAHGNQVPVSRIPGAHVWLLAFLLLPAIAHGQAGVAAPTPGYSLPAAPIFVFSGGSWVPATSGNPLNVSCVAGCSAAGAFTDNTAFTVGTSTITNLGAYFTSGAAPSISTGNSGRIRMDANSYLYVDCVTGCSASAGFADNTAFTAGTTAIGITGGWYSTSPTNCTSGNACAPQLTIDRKLFVQDFQGTSPWVVSANGGTFAVTQSGSWTITANAGTNLNTSALALDTSVNGILNAQASTTSGEKGPLDQCAATTSAPSYTTAQTDPLSCNLSGGLRVDGSGVTQPVSGTVTANAGTGQFNVTCTAANCPVNVAQFGGVNVSTGTGASGTGIPRVTVSNDSSLAANQSVNVNQVAGASTGATNPLYTAVADGTNGPAAVKAASTAAVATDKALVVAVSPNNSVAVTGTFFQTTQPVSCTAANCAVNVAQINGNTTSTAASGTQLVGIEGHAGVAVDGATGSAVPANALYLGGNGSGNTTGLITCDNSAAFNLTTGTTTQIIAISGTGGRTYICSFNIVVSAADNVTLISGSGTNCASNVAALIGGTTAANGWNFAANGGLTMGSGVGMIIKTTTTNNEVCLVTSATAVASGSITYTQF